MIKIYGVLWRHQAIIPIACKVTLPECYVISITWFISLVPYRTVLVYSYILNWCVKLTSMTFFMTTHHFCVPCTIFFDHIKFRYYAMVQYDMTLHKAEHSDQGSRSYLQLITQRTLHISRDHSRFAPSQWEMALLCNDVSHWLGASLESALDISL